MHQNRGLKKGGGWKEGGWRLEPFWERGSMMIAVVQNGVMNVMNVMNVNCILTVSQVLHLCSPSLSRTPAMSLCVCVCVFRKK